MFIRKKSTEHRRKQTTENYEQNFNNPLVLELPKQIPSQTPIREVSEENVFEVGSPKSAIIRAKTNNSLKMFSDFCEDSSSNLTNNVKKGSKENVENSDSDSSDEYVVPVQRMKSFNILPETEFHPNFSTPLMGSHKQEYESYDEGIFKFDEELSE